MLRARNRLHQPQHPRQNQHRNPQHPLPMQRRPPAQVPTRLQIKLPSQLLLPRRPSRAKTVHRSPRPLKPAADAAEPGEITEEQLKQMLVGRTFYLRGGYLGDSLAFNEHGRLSGHPTPGSYTLSLIEIDRVHLSKHKVELEGVRFGLHFLGALPYEDPATAVDKVRITPRKKIVKISIDRELVVKPKKVKEEKSAKGGKDKPGPATANPAAVAANLESGSRRPECRVQPRSR